MPLLWMGVRLLAVASAAMLAGCDALSWESKDAGDPYADIAHPKCDGDGLPFADGDCRKCPEGTALKEKTEKPESASGGVGFAIGHGGPTIWGGGSGHEPILYGTMWCEDAQGRKGGPLLHRALTTSEATVLERGEYRDDQKVGEWKELDGEGTYVSGKRHGTWREFNDSHSGEYIHGVKQGPWVEGKSAGSYKDGRREGPWKLEAFRGFALPSPAEGSLEKGVPVGTWKYKEGETVHSGRLITTSDGLNFQQAGLWSGVYAGQRTTTRCFVDAPEPVWIDWEGKREDCPPKPE